MLCSNVWQKCMTRRRCLCNPTPTSNSTHILGVYMAWLEADLAKAATAREAGEIDFIIAGGHRPFTNDAWNDDVGALFLKVSDGQGVVE